MYSTPCIENPGGKGCWLRGILCQPGTVSSLLLHVASCVILCACMRSVITNSLRPRGLYPASLLCPWDFPCKNTRLDCYFLLQGIFLSQGLNPRLLHWQVGSLTTEPPGKPFYKSFYQPLILKSIRFFIFYHGFLSERLHTNNQFISTLTNISTWLRS